jgi:hypothetical protein
MRTKKILINCLFWAIPILASAVDFNRLVDAVAVAESNNDSQAVGDGGKARGAYQMWQIAWQQTTVERRKEGKQVYHFAYAHDAFVSREYAKSYLEWCAKAMERKLGRPATSWETYACYARGIGNFEDINYRYDRLPARTKKAIGKIYARLGEPLPE